MALLKTGSYKNTGTVYLDYKLYADEISGSGNNRTIRVTVEFKCGGNPSYPSWYGYPCYWQPYVNSSYGSTGTIKGGESWNTNNGYRSFSQDINVNVGTTSSTTVNVGFTTNSTGDDGWDGGASASFSVDSTNTPPVISGSVTADGTTSSKYIMESQQTIGMSWPAASDGNGNLAGYRIRVSINGGGYTEIGRTNNSTTSFTHNVAGYGSGTSFKYAVDAFDYESAWSSGSALSGTLTKNTMTKATLAAIPSIAYDSTSIKIDWSGASNQVSDRTFYYSLTCGDLGAKWDTMESTLTIPIATTAPSSGPYILKSDLINFVKNSSYKGTLNFTLKTTNTYGSNASDTKSSSVNMQSPPATPKPVINTTDDTPDSLNIWRTAADTKNRYMIPDGTRRIRVSWPAIVGASGEPISYDVFYSLDSGWISLGNQTGTTYNLVLPAVNKLTIINFMVRAKSSYGLVSGDGISLGQNLHYYRSPYLMTGKLTRTDSTAVLQAMCKSESSIPNINTKGTYIITPGGVSTALPLSQADYSNLSFSGLTGDGVYTVTFTYNDGTGFTPTNRTETYTIGANLPSVFVNKYGLGVGGFFADASVALKVNGNGYIKGLFTTEGNLNCTGNLNGGSISCTGNANIRGILTTGDTITARNTESGDVGVVFDRNTGANYRVINSAGMLHFQTDWTDKKGPWYNVMKLYCTSGNVEINTGDLILSNNLKYIYGMDAKGANRIMIGPWNNSLIIGMNTNRHDTVQVYGNKFEFNEQTVKIDDYHIPVVPGISNTTTAYIAIPNLYSNDSCGQYLLNLEYNHHYQGSSIYWSSHTAIIGISTVWDGTRVVNRATLVNLSHSGSDGGGWNLIWEAPWNKDKAAGSSSRLTLLFTKNADNTDINKIVRDVKLVKLSSL